MRMRKKPNLVPRMEACSEVWIRNPEDRRGSWRTLFPSCRAVWLEVGCGKGKFTAETAAANPDILLLAMERVPEAMVMAMEKVRRMGLTNVYFIGEDVARLQDFFSPGEIDLLFINFCDPWPKARHANRRLTYRAFLQLYRQILPTGGTVELKTDNQALFEFSLEEFAACGFSLRDVTRNLHANGPVGIMTGYEEKFYHSGTPICRCVAIKEEAT